MGTSVTLATAVQRPCFPPQGPGSIPCDEGRYPAYGTLNYVTHRSVTVPNKGLVPCHGGWIPHTVPCGEVASVRKDLKYEKLCEVGTRCDPPWPNQAVVTFATCICYLLSLFEMGTCGHVAPHRIEATTMFVSLVTSLVPL